MYFVYIIRNQENLLYKGFTTNPVKRVKHHNTGLSEYTKNKGPWEIVFLKEFESKKQALTYEKMLKRQNHKYLEWLIKSDKNEFDKVWGRLG